MASQLSQFSVTVKENGRVNLPSGLRNRLQLHEGEDLIFRVRDDGSAEVITRTVLAQRGRGLFAHLKIVEDETALFLQERRQETE